MEEERKEIKNFDRHTRKTKNRDWDNEEDDEETRRRNEKKK